jgi:hypothetical protein
MTVHLFAAGPDWGSVPDWLAALGTVAAFAVALQLLAKELEVRREAEEDRRSEQARLVSAWPQDPFWEQGQTWLPVAIRNGSSEPVYQVRAVMVPPESPYASDPEVATADVNKVRVRREIVAPGQLTIAHFGIEALNVVPGPISVSFIDAAGRRWKRYPDGRLVETDRPWRRSNQNDYSAWIAGWRTSPTRRRPGG